ncbi:hypothetical protein ALGA_4216 [Labilibaculum antarcticum]|uniref:Uncharacterized protein n=1 Tax=Labilibaculum antarcticum TaxID=1717717 RepID=A0A1Y1CQ06_9BACT|nr:hypothetical protein ALGA_4216 [Labilibaculum antarcticum]
MPALAEEWDDVTVIVRLILKMKFKVKLLKKAGDKDLALDKGEDKGFAEVE